MKSLLSQAAKYKQTVKWFKIHIYIYIFIISQCVPKTSFSWALNKTGDFRFTVSPSLFRIE